MQHSLNFSALPSDASARFMRFERYERLDVDSAGYEALAPVAYVQEWQWPRNNAGHASNEADFRTVRISEHKWPLYKSTFMCRGPQADRVEWPEPSEPTTRHDLVQCGLIVPAWDYHLPVDFDESVGLLCDESTGRAIFKSFNGNPEPNDGLPEDYLDFWREDAEIEVSDAG